jgi:cysteinyl-tRNA synthetase
MGEPRFRILEEQLPASALILGIDEYTACVIDLAQEECRVMGAGGVTLRRRGRKESEQSYPAGATFPLSDLVAASSRISVLQSLPSPLEAPLQDSSYWAHRLQEWIAKIEAILHLSQEKDWDAVAAMGYLLDLARAMEKAEETGVEATLIDEARAQLRRSLGVWGVRWDSLRGERSTEVGPMVDLLVQIRSRLRDAKQWALADEIRNGLSALGILLEDTPEGPRWRQNT